MFAARHGFKVFTGARYLEGCIVDKDSRRDCLREPILTWDNNTGTIIKTAGGYPQESYAAVARAIQSECIFLQCVTWYTRYAFALLDQVIRETFLPRLFFGITESLSPIIGSLSVITVKISGLVLLNPVTSAKEKYLS